MTCSIEWDGIAVAISHTPDWLNTDYHHIELRADEALPVTGTGYRSHFIHRDEFALFDGPADFVRQWLDQAARSPDWQKRREAGRQLSLF